LLLEVAMFLLTLASNMAKLHSETAMSAMS
jgi:hypothetical protein